MLAAATKHGLLRAALGRGRERCGASAGCPLYTAGEKPRGLIPARGCGSSRVKPHAVPQQDVLYGAPNLGRRLAPTNAQAITTKRCYLGLLFGHGFVTITLCSAALFVRGHVVCISEPPSAARCGRTTRQQMHYLAQSAA